MKRKREQPTLGGLRLLIAWLAFAMTVLPALPSSGATVAHWRFESGALLISEAAGGTLTNVGGNNTNDSFTLPATGNGSAFPKTIPLTGATNGTAALFTKSESPSDMFNAGQSLGLSGFAVTVEAFVNMASAPGSFNDRVVFARENAFTLSVANSLDGAAPIYTFRGQNSAGSTVIRDVLAPGTFALAPNKDYFIAATSGIIGTNSQTFVRLVVLYLKDLTANGPLRMYVAPQLTMGTSVSSTSNWAYIGFEGFTSQENWDGLMDEVKVSNSVLGESGLQITAPGSLPVVEISATDIAANEGGDAAAFRITRTGSTASSLTVNLEVFGDAANGVDFQTIAPTVVIPAGAAEVTVPVIPLADGSTEGNERVVAVVQLGSTYVVGPALGASVSITDAADLTALAISSGTLSPTFAIGTTNYTASVAAAVSSITVTPTKANPDATIQVRVNGGAFVDVTSGTASGDLALNVGANPVEVKVTGLGGTPTKTYTVTVTRSSPPSSNADLSSLTLSAGTLAPSFASAATSYTASVPNATASMTVTPTKADANAAIQVRVNAGAYANVNSGSASAGLALNVGTNSIDVKVTAQDGTTIKTYTVTVTRESAIQTWRQTWYGTTSSTGNAADLADPYKIGLSNLAVFAFFGPGQDPAQAKISLLPKPQISGANYVVTFTQPSGVTGVTYGAEWRAELTGGTWQPITDTGSGSVHTFSLPIAGNPKVVMRLKVTLP